MRNEMSVVSESTALCYTTIFPTGVSTHFTDRKTEFHISDPGVGSRNIYQMPLLRTKGKKLLILKGIESSREPDMK